MDFKYLFLRTDGRISRMSWWIGSVIMGVIYALVYFLIFPLFGLGLPNAATIKSMDEVLAAMRGQAWGGLIVYALLAYPGYCLGVKRRHDRNNKGVDVLIYWGLAIAVGLIQALGLGFALSEVNGVILPTPTVVGMVVGGISAVFGIYMLVVLGFLKGTAGANDYGPDPLSKA